MKKQKNNQKQLGVTDFIVSPKQMSLDMAMVPYDIWGTTAHVLMLFKQKIISKEEVKKILKALQEIEKELKKEKFVIDSNKGAQLSLEAKIIEKAAIVGFSVHTGRSRNDQVMVTEMLYLKEQILIVVQKLAFIQKELFSLAQKHVNTVMPGYTHMQPAKPTTFGQWCLAYFYGFSKAFETLKHYYQLYNLNPLGACESYGTSWPINRKYTTDLLEFKEPWEIPQDAISSRGFPQLGYLTALSEICLVASKLAQDLLLFNTFEFNLIALGDAVAQRMHPITGSSVMAQKKNPDALELIRSTAPQVSGFVSIMSNILSSLPMGYNRDSREAKEYINLGLSKTLAMLNALKIVLNFIQVNKEQMKKSVMTNYSLTTDLADYISQKNKVGYRLVYKIVGQVVNEKINYGKFLSDISAHEIIKKAEELKIKLKITETEIEELLDSQNAVAKRQHIGGSSPQSMNESLNKVKKNIEKLDLWLKNKQKLISVSKEKIHKQIINLLTK
ncbi:argininosuccinate lyase [Candidatus Roizmanbacteria bacterium CG2_30_33_16]|uniref:Argininosuccinate lyase n=3 Tax=Candidatus Roizmaniibacteriota TaxID=1752723 RepID=A0A2H0C4N6_9BACT|nr:argininosuccinate lyase [Candidatus Roizmanbacteria bacterium]OIP83203.1 MAG: argininosuccinate lyase [Candidatus Roizmanbacteria bacterium CG2_30_33_16]PIP64874.1 MAG: argininosuccinate lyase [Candidatus Roizmanbacteria bacterium CG22_combo_CG10-13_8_21_14_all_33_16]PIX72165.1 MAG: argininosuccinate lyase [Candidatus Roizmanbacteria bacterium CG_4_10_14_3_um_filter_33_21]